LNVIGSTLRGTNVWRRASFIECSGTQAGLVRAAASALAWSTAFSNNMSVTAGGAFTLNATAGLRYRIAMTVDLTYTANPATAGDGYIILTSWVTLNLPYRFSVNSASYPFPVALSVSTVYDLDSTAAGAQTISVQFQDTLAVAVTANMTVHAYIIEY